MSGARYGALLSALVSLGAIVLTPAPALAFCRTMACSNTEPELQCSRDKQGCLVNDRPLFWPTSCISFGVHEDGSLLRKIDYTTSHDLIVAAFESWLFADCGGGKVPTLSVKDYGKIECDRREYNSDDRNANVFLFRDDYWPYENSEDTLALTTITFNKDTGAIYDADVEINSFDANITVTDSGVVADFSSIITHEVGHFLGLSHSSVPGATMRPGYHPGDTTLRSLSTDDIAGICSLYPPGSEVEGGSCDPRHGFSRVCASEESGCAVQRAPGAPAKAAGLVAFALGLGVVALRRRDRKNAGRAGRVR